MSELLTPKQVAEKLNISLSMVYKLIRDKRIKYVKIGRSKRIPAEALDEFIQKNTEGLWTY
jgi:excisionase family DNA binding protein